MIEVAEAPPVATPVAPPHVQPAPPRREGSILRRVLQDRQGLLEEIVEGKQLPMGKVALISFVLTSIGGLGVGASNGALQAISAAVKLPLITLGALLVCFPAFYIFGLLQGSRISVEKTLRMLAVGLGLRGAIIAGLAPLLIFFSGVGSPYGFLLLASGITFGIAEIGLMKTLDLGIRTLREKTHDPFSQWLVRGWMVLYMAIALQLTWSLRPVIGNPSMQGFHLIGGCPGEGNMFTYFLQHVSQLMHP
jgi:hypothetical protein